MINRYTVIGQPVAHSLSPAIHHIFGELTQRKIAYTRTEASTETFEQQVLEWREQGGKGCNVTTPFKDQAAQLCDRLHESAQLAQAVNTIHMHRDGALVGHITDGLGLLSDLQKNKQTPIAGKHILLVGAGGAARATLAPLLKAKPARLVVVNRTIGKAQALVTTFESVGKLEAASFDDLPDAGNFDVVINGTSMGFDGDKPPLPAGLFANNALAYDMMYNANGTPFLEWAAQNGASRTSDGFGMLVEQAADSFAIWEGVRPKTRMLYPRTSEILASV